MLTFNRRRDRFAAAVTGAITAIRTFYEAFLDEQFRGAQRERGRLAAAVPSRTGRLARSWRITRRGGILRIRNNAPYARFVRYATPRRGARTARGTLIRWARTDLLRVQRSAFQRTVRRFQ